MALTGHKMRFILTPIAFANKCLSSAEQRHNSIEWEALGILYVVEKFHHYCFAAKVHIITDHKILVAMVRKDLVTLSQRLPCIMQQIHQY